MRGIGGLEIKNKQVKVVSLSCLLFTYKNNDLIIIYYRTMIHISDIVFERTIIECDFFVSIIIGYSIKFIVSEITIREANIRWFIAKIKGINKYSGIVANNVVNITICARYV